MLRSLLLLLEAQAPILGGDHRGHDSGNEPSPLYFRNSCHRKSMARIQKYHGFLSAPLEWMDLKEVGVQFLAGKLELRDPLVLEAEQKVGANLHEVGQLYECPIGSMFFRLFSIMFADPKIRRSALVDRKFGCEMLYYRAAYLDFITIASSGWPYFEMMQRLSNMLPASSAAERYSENLCKVHGWPEDTDFKRSMKMGNATLELAFGAASVKWCPWQRIASYSLQARLIAQQGLTLARYRVIDELLILVEENLLEWSSRDHRPCKNNRALPYFYDLLISRWPILQELVALSDILVKSLTVTCERRGPDRPLYKFKPRVGGGNRGSRAAQCIEKDGRSDECDWGEKWGAANEGEDRNATIPGAVDARRCPACDTPFQSDFIREAEYVRKFYREVERISTSDENTIPRPENFNWSRHAFATYLYPGNNSESQADFIRVLAHSVREIHGEDSRFIVITESSIDNEIKTSLEEFHEVRICTPMVTSENAWGPNAHSDAYTEYLRRQWWLDRNQAPTVLSLCLWNFLDLLSIICLDTDMLVMSPMWDLFALDVPFAAGEDPYESIEFWKFGYKWAPRIQAGIMMVRPSIMVYSQLKTRMIEGLSSKLLDAVGYSEQPWLDTFWIQHSPRILCPDVKLCKTVECEKKASLKSVHCLIPNKYNFLVDYKTIRLHATLLIDRMGPQGNDTIDDTLEALAHSLEFGLSDIKAIHWPGELRKPWHKLSPMVRSPWDDIWWDMKEKACSMQDCFIEC